MEATPTNDFHTLKHPKKSQLGIANLHLTSDPGQLSGEITIWTAANTTTAKIIYFEIKFESHIMNLKICWLT
jgi:hypothetical protein